MLTSASRQLSSNIYCTQPPHAEVTELLSSNWTLTLNCQDRGPGEWALVDLCYCHVSAGPHARCEPYGQPQQLVPCSLCIPADPHEVGNGVDTAAVSTSIPQGNPFLFRMDNQLYRGAELSTRSHRWSARDALSGPLLLGDCAALQTAVAGAPRPLVPLPPRPPSEPGGVADAMPGSCSCSRAQARSCAPGGAYNCFEFLASQRVAAEIDFVNI